MTLESLRDGLGGDLISDKDARLIIQEKKNMKLINYFLNRDKITASPLKRSEISQLSAIVDILQTLYNSKKGSPISDEKYDVLQEILVNNGIPRLTGSVEINDSSKGNHLYPVLRGSLSKVYYLTMDETRVNKSRRYLDEWIQSISLKYEKETGGKLNSDNLKVLLQPKFDGASVVMECSEDKVRWLTRGDTRNNLATDVTHIMNVFNDVYYEENSATKFEVMCSEDSLEKINMMGTEYSDSRQVVTAVLNSASPDPKVNHIYPVPLRIISQGDTVEKIHPSLIDKFPTEICLLSDRDTIRKFSTRNKWVIMNGIKFRTDGIVITILDPEIQKILGRENNINNFEIAYKFTEEFAYSKVVDIRFDVSEFGFISPVLIFDPVLLKGKRISNATMSNKDRFDELRFHYGDMVKVLYDIIPYVTVDEKCIRSAKSRIKFPTKCPSCIEPLDLNVTMVRCNNLECRSRILGRILNYCDKVRIRNIGHETLAALFQARLLDKGILSLYKLKKYTHVIERLDGFGHLKARKIISEINAKKKLKDYEFFGAIGIDSLSSKTFQTIFSELTLEELLTFIFNKDSASLRSRLISIKGIGTEKADILCKYYKAASNIKELNKLMKEVSVVSTTGKEIFKGRVVFSGFRDNDLREYIESAGYEVSDTWTNKSTHLVVKDTNGVSAKIEKARSVGAKIISADDARKELQ